jgi:hypothetical protein
MLTVDALAEYTEGRLDPNTDETQRQLDAALTAARRYCGWHVTPVLTATTVTLDGPGQKFLVLPTMSLAGISAVTENGISINTASLGWSVRGLVVKTDNTFWAEGFSNITVTMTHGYAVAADFESVVFSSIDRGGFATGDTARVIGPFQYSDPAGGAGQIFTASERQILDYYKLEKQP